MKTFDEAFNKIAGTKEPDDLLVLVANMKAYQDEQFGNAWFTRTIDVMVRQTATSCALAGPKGIPAVLASRLHLMFQLGLLVGIEMEKL